MYTRSVIFLGFIAVVVPQISFAAVSDFFGLGDLIYEILARIGILFWAIAIAVFFWGLVKFINNAGDTAEHEKGKSLIVWGIVSFVVLVSLWGLVAFLNSSFGLSAPLAPTYRDKNGTVVTP